MDTCGGYWLEAGCERMTWEYLEKVIALEIVREMSGTLQARSVASALSTYLGGQGQSSNFFGPVPSDPKPLISQKLLYSL